MEETDIDILADKIVRKLEKGLLRLPTDFKNNAYGGYYIGTQNVMSKNPACPYVIEQYITNDGSLIWRLKDCEGMMLMERVFR